MASSTVLDRIDTSNARLEAQIQSLRDTQNTKYNVLIWVIGFATVILSAVITLNSIFS